MWFTVGLRIKYGRVLKGSITDGFRIFRYKIRRRKKTLYRHRFFYKLVAECFLEKPSEEQTCLLHLDHNLSNDHVSNLKWATKQEMLDHHRTNPKVIDCETFEITDEGVIRDKNFTYRTNSIQERLIPIIENERYTNIETLIENNKDKVKTGEGYDYDDDWINRVEKRLSFKLPDSYIWLMSKYGSITFDFDRRVKVITYPDFRPDQETSILNQTNRKNRGLSSKQLIIMENDKETYYFLFEKDLVSNEYKVYKMNNRTKATELFANDFLEFIKLQINQYDHFGRKIE